MSRGAVAVLRDPELVELLATEPQLLAIADAIASVAPARRKSRRPPRVIGAALAVAAVVALALVAPWDDSHGGVLAQALAAVSAKPVLHVVLVSQLPDTTTLNLRSGHSSPATLRIETWFDAQRALRRTVVVRGGTRTDELATPQGVWSQYGRVPTCAWIAAHPAQAAKLRVSCSAAASQRLSEARPTVDPALAAFVGGYQLALRSGRARNLGTAHLGAHEVYWIGFTLQSSGSVRTERVAVDRQTFRPLVYEAVSNGRVVAKARVLTIGSVAFRPALFMRPAVGRSLPPVAGEVAKTRHVRLAGAEAALGGAVRSLGGSFATLPFTDARLDDLTTGYGPLSGKPVRHGRGVELIYGDSGGFLNGNAFLRLSESLAPQFAYGMQAGGAFVTEGTLQLTRLENETLATSGHPAVRRALWFGQLKTKSGLYVALQGSSRRLVLQAAHALEGSS
jgi:hypothetical protein